MITAMTRLLTIEDLAELVGWSKATVYQRRYRGASLPPSIVIDQTIRFRAEDVDAWLISHTTTKATDDEISQLT